MEKVANSKVTIPCPAEGTKWFTDESALDGMEEKCNQKLGV